MFRRSSFQLLIFSFLTITLLLLSLTLFFSKQKTNNNRPINYTGNYVRVSLLVPSGWSLKETQGFTDDQGIRTNSSIVLENKSLKVTLAITQNFFGGIEGVLAYTRDTLIDGTRVELDYMKYSPSSAVDSIDSTFKQNGNGYYIHATGNVEDPHSEVEIYNILESIKVLN